MSGDGKYIVVVKMAKNLPVGNSGGEVYCKVAVGNRQSSIVRKTRQVAKKSIPEFDERFTFDAAAGNLLRVAVCDFDPKKENETEIGSVTVNLLDPKSFPLGRLNELQLFAPDGKGSKVPSGTIVVGAEMLTGDYDTSAPSKSIPSRSAGPPPAANLGQHLLDFLIKNGWLMYLLAVFICVGMKYGHIFEPVKLPYADGQCLKIGESLSSPKHTLYLSATANLNLYRGAAADPATSEPIWTSPNDPIKSAKSYTACFASDATDAGTTLTLAKGKVVAWTITREAPASDDGHRPIRRLL